ncbi:MAG: hypothetical protein M3P33_04050 [bacterium]|nr:hypothetical protein [bacterium]
MSSFDKSNYVRNSRIIVSTTVDIEEVIIKSSLQRFDSLLESADTPIEKQSIFAKITYLIKSNNSEIFVYAIHGMYGHITKDPTDIAAYYKINITNASIEEFQQYSQKFQTILIDKTTKQVQVSKLQQYLPILTPASINKFILLNAIIVREYNCPYQAQIIINDDNNLLIKHISITPPEIITQKTFYPHFDTNYSKKGIVVGKIYLLTEKSNLQVLPSSVILIISTKTKNLKEALKKASGLILKTKTISIQELASNGFHKPVVIVSQQHYKDLKNNDLVSINSNTGEIKKLNKPKGKSKDVKESKPYGLKKLEQVHALDAENVEFDPQENSTIVFNNDKMIHDSIVQNKLVQYLESYLKINQDTKLFFESFHTFKSSAESDRYLSQELKNVKQLLHELKVKKVIYILGQTIYTDDLTQFKDKMHSLAITRSLRFKLYFSISTMSHAITLEKIIDEGLDGLVFDWKKMTESIYGFHSTLDDAKFLSLSQTQAVWDILNVCVDLAQRRNIDIYVKTFDEIDAKLINKLTSLTTKGILISQTQQHHSNPINSHSFVTL